jgi:hypothetical protein
MIPWDTDITAHEAQIVAYRRMGPEARVRLAAEMSEDARRISLEGIRARHPEYDDDRARRALFGLLLGEELARRLWPTETPVPP